MQRHEEWFLFAERDLKSASVLQAQELLGTAVYHAQQCAEKALKGYLAFKEQPIKRTHDLVELVELCFEFDASFDVLIDDAKYLKPYATQGRYPDEYDIPDEEDTLLAIKRAAAIFDFIKKKVL